MTKYFYVLTLSCFLLLAFASNLLAQSPDPNDPRRCQEDARISVAFSGETELLTCRDDDRRDRIRFQIQPFAQAFAFFVVDENDVILCLSFSNFINFDMLPAGRLRVFAFSTYGRINAEVGDVYTDVQLSTPCAGLTANFVSVINSTSGDISIASEAAEYTICPADGVSDVINVSSPAAAVTYLITDREGNILDTTTSTALDFEGAAAGVCRVYAYANPAPLPVRPGDNLSELPDLDGCGVGLSTNWITVNRIVVQGGTIASNMGDELRICPGDGQDNRIDFTVNGNTGENNRLVFTDTANVVLGSFGNSFINFDVFPEGICRVYNVSFNGDFPVRELDDLDNLPVEAGCVGLTENFITVRREPAVGGTVATLDGATEVETCPGDGVDDVIDFTVTGAAGGELVYLITDDQNVILDLSSTPSFDVEGAGVGVCRIWALSYQGELIATVGTDAGTAELATGCFALSDNFITVTRALPIGGTVATNLGESTVRVCPNDGVADDITFVSFDAAAANFVFLITDDDNIVLSVAAGATVDFDDAAEGVCRVWGLSYNGTLLVEPGQDATTAALSSECFALSDNFVTVIRTIPEAGTIRLENGGNSASICPMDGVSDVLTFVVTGASDDPSAFVVTDIEGNVLRLPLGNAVDFDDVPPGVCRIYNLSYFGTLTVAVGDNINEDELADGCFDLSETFITVERQEAMTGTVSTEDGETAVLACPGDAIPDPILFDSTGTTLSRFNYLVTDTNNVVLQVPFSHRIDFERLPLGVCRVHGLGYEGVIVAAPGDTAGVDDLASGCFALSENFVTVTKQRPVGGTITTTAGEDRVTICPMDGVADAITVQRTGAEGANLVYVITTDENIILEAGAGPTFDFEDAPVGVCRIWSLSYQGDLTAQIGADAAAGGLASGCFELSENFVTVVRMDLMSSTLSLAGDLTEVSICPDDGSPDLLAFLNDDDSGSDFQYVVTDQDDVVLALVNGSSFDFDPSGPGVCRVWGFAYAGEVLLAAGDTITTAPLASGCEALSTNFLTVVRETPVGGEISLANGANSVTVCSGVDSEPPLNFVTTSTTSNYAYLIVQEDSFALASFDEQFNFNNALAGEYRIYGVSFGGTLTVRPGQNIFTSDIAESCFELSTNFVDVTVERVNGGVVMGNDSTEVFLCTDNPADGLVEFSSTSDLTDENYRYVITTASDIAQIVLRITEVGETSFDFAALPLEEVRVYGLSYTGEFSGSTGSPISSMLATSCLDLSDNFITVFNDTPMAGDISFENVPANGLACVVDGDGSISVTTTSTSLTGYAVVVTDSMNIVQLVALDPTNVDLGSLPQSGYRVYGLAYTGNVTVEVGDDLALVALANNCFELTSTFLNVTRGEELSAGLLTNLTTAGTGDTITFCGTDPAPVTIVGTNIEDPNYRYIVTDENGRVRAANLLSNIIPFQAFGPGVYRIYGFNFTGTPLINVNQNIFSNALSTRCSALSDNFITVRFLDPAAGEVTTADGATAVEVEIEGDGEAATAVVALNTTFAGEEDFLYLITDADNRLLATTAAAEYDFGPAGVGVCRVWGLAYTGELTLAIGEDVTVAELAAGCADLSSGFLEVTRVNEVGLDVPTSEDQVSALSLTARPNPVGSGSLHLDLTSAEPLPDAQVHVRDMNGTAYLVQPLSGGSSTATVELDVSGLPAGVYFAQVATATGIFSVRFVRE